MYIYDLADDVLDNIAINADDTTFCSKYNQASNLWEQLKPASKLGYGFQDRAD